MMKKKLAAFLLVAALTASVMPAYADSFSDLDISRFIGGPLNATISKQQQDLFRYTEYTSDSKATQPTTTATFHFSSPDGTAYDIDVPLLTLVPIPAIAMEDATVTFDMEVNRSGQDKVSATADASDSTSTLWEIFALQIMQGNGSGLDLDRKITQAELVKMVVSALGEGPENTDGAGHWAEGYVKRAIADGWLKTSLADFDYNKQVTYIEAENLLTEILGYGDMDAVDLSGGTGYAYGNENITRYQAAIMLHNALNTPLCADGEIMDGKNGAYRTLLTEAHSVYTASGYIESIGEADEYLQDESLQIVRFSAQESDNLNGKRIDQADESTYLTIHTFLDDANTTVCKDNYVTVLLKNHNDEFYSILSIRDIEKS